MTNKAYCPNCDEEKDYILKSVTKKVTVRGMSFEVEIKEAYCTYCGNQVFPDKVAKQNDLIIYDEYRRLNGLLTSDEIKAIRRKRDLSQTDLAKLICCGEKNIARYETGTIQDKAFDLLIRLVGTDAGYECISRLKNK